MPFLIKSLQNDLPAGAGAMTLVDQLQDIARKRDAMSIQQSVEWGKHAVQSSFPRLKDTLSCEEYGE